VASLKTRCRFSYDICSKVAFAISCAFLLYERLDGPRKELVKIFSPEAKFRFTGPQGKVCAL